MRTKYIFILFVTLGLVACGEIDESNLKNYPAKLYLGTSGYNLTEVYDLGEGQLVKDVYVSKSGFYDKSADVILEYDPSALTEYQEATQSGEELAVLPENVGVLKEVKLAFDADATLAGTQLTFDMNALRANIPKDREVKYVYPVRIKSATEGVEINTDKDYVLLAIQLLTPQANLRGRGALIEANCDPYRGTNMDKIPVPLTMDLPFDNKDMRLEFTYEADPSLVDEYNNRYGTSYQLLPEIYTTPPLVIEAGNISGTTELEVDPSTLERDFEGKSYLLPVRITGCDNPSVRIQDGSVVYLKIGTSAKYTGTWTETILAGEENVSTTPGSVMSVKLYGRKAAVAHQIGDANCQSMMADNITDDEAILCPGWGGNLYEQCSPIIKITDEDAGNGRKKVEIIAGWFGDIWTDWGGTAPHDNNSWYDPNTLTLHLEFSGAFSWSTYTFKREFTNPIFDSL